MISALFISELSISKAQFFNDVYNTDA